MTPDENNTPNVTSSLLAFFRDNPSIAEKSSWLRHSLMSFSCLQGYSSLHRILVFRDENSLCIYRVRWLDCCHYFSSISFIFSRGCVVLSASRVQYLDLNSCKVKQSSFHVYTYIYSAKQRCYFLVIFVFILGLPLTSFTTSILTSPQDTFLSQYQ